MKSVNIYFFLLLSFLTIANLNLFAQADSSIAKNSIYVELYGNGMIGSVNYDRLFFIKKNKFSFRVGVLYLPVSGESLYNIPIEVNYLKGEKKHLEFGFGLSYANGFYSSNSDVSVGSDFTYKEEYSRALYLFLKPIGYRFQKREGGVFFKASGLILYKAYELNENYIQPDYEIILSPFFGLSVGYTFKNKKRFKN